MSELGAAVNPVSGARAFATQRHSAFDHSRVPTGVQRLDLEHAVALRQPVIGDAGSHGVIGPVSRRQRKLTGSKRPPGWLEVNEKTADVPAGGSTAWDGAPW